MASAPATPRCWSRKHLTKCRSQRSIAGDHPARQRGGHDHRAIAKAASQALRKAYDLGWAPERYLAAPAFDHVGAQTGGGGQVEGRHDQLLAEGSRTLAGPMHPTTGNGLRSSTNT